MLIFSLWVRVPLIFICGLGAWLGAVAVAWYFSFSSYMPFTEVVAVGDLWRGVVVATLLSLLMPSVILGEAVKEWRFNILTPGAPFVAGYMIGFFIGFLFGGDPEAYEEIGVNRLTGIWAGMSCSVIQGLINSFLFYKLRPSFDEFIRDMKFR